MTELRIADTFALPLDTLVESTAVLAKKGAGKTNLGVVIVEEAYAAGVAVVVVDPKGDWWGIRAGADGTPEGGLPILVLGGLLGDLPLNPTAGAYIADLVRERSLSVVLDVSEFDSDAERRRFLTAFADRLYKRPERTPVHLMLEEAHEYIPQGVTGEDAKMVGVFARIVKQGRFKGIGVTMMTQRSASLNKNVLTQVDNLFMMRTGSPQDRAAVQSWVASHGEAKAIIDSLPGLATGEFWLWQPQRGEPVRARARMRHTYDAGATPRIGETLRPPATLTDVDVQALGEAMRETLEKRATEDPAVLHATIARHVRTIEQRDDVIRGLEMANADLRSSPPAVQETVRVPDAIVFSLEALRGQLLELHKHTTEILDAAARINAEAPTAQTAAKPAVQAAPASKQAQIAPVATAAPVSRPLTPGVADPQLSSYERDVLTVLAQFPTLSTKQIAFRAQKSPKSSTFLRVIPFLRRSGYIEGSSAAYSITAAGREALGDFEPLPQGPALVDHWLRTLKPTEAAVLEALVKAWPQPVSVAELAERTGRSATSSTFMGAVPALKKWELAYGTKDAMFADDVLGEALMAGSPTI